MLRRRFSHPSLLGPGRRVLLSTLERVTIRVAILLGFTMVLVLWLLSGWNLLDELEMADAEATATQARYNEADRQLSALTTHIFLSAIYLRDALSDAGPLTGDYYRQQLDAQRRALASAADGLGPVVGSERERDQVAALRKDLADYLETVAAVTDRAATMSPAEALLVLRRVVLPKREQVVRMSEEVQALNRQAFEEERAQRARGRREMYRRFWYSSGAALLLSLLVAVVVFAHAGRLERRLLGQMRRDADATRELHRLSASLVRAQEDERRVIARELHDEVGQALTAIKAQLAVALRDAGEGGRFRERVEEARAVTERTIQTVRDLSHLLRPSILDDLGLPSAIEAYLRDFSKRTAIAAELLQQGFDARLAPEIEVTIFRIVQEALTNIARHARASSCRVYLQRLPTTVLLTVEDDGQGFDPADLGRGAARRGMGLFGIQERVEGFRGSYRIESRPGQGTRLTVELPALEPTGAGEAVERGEG